MEYSGGKSVIVYMYPCHGQKRNQEWQYREVSEGRANQGIIIERLAKRDITERSVKGGQNRDQCRDDC